MNVLSISTEARRLPESMPAQALAPKAVVADIYDRITNALRTMVQANCNLLGGVAKTLEPDEYKENTLCPELVIPLLVKAVSKSLDQAYEVLDELEDLAKGAGQVRCVLAAEEDVWHEVSAGIEPPHLVEVDVYIAADNYVERGFYNVEKGQWHSTLEDGEAYPERAVTHWRQGSRPGGRQWHE